MPKSLNFHHHHHQLSTTLQSHTSLFPSLLLPYTTFKMFKLVSITTIALAAIANAMPQGIGTGSNACPPGCKTKDVFESKTPDPHQTYFYQQMTVSLILYLSSETLANSIRTIISVARMAGVRSPRAK